jgi:2-haloacid dehalogenase
VRRAIDPDSIYTLSFDCYGTLIDWRRGVAEAARSIPALRNADLARLVADRELIEREIELGPYLPYGEVVARSIGEAARAQDLELSTDEARAFAASQASWPPFEEARQVLAILAERWQLVILSNVEDEVLRASVRLLGAPFEELVTAEQLRSYKPKPAHFEAALARLGIEKQNLLHVACSLYHDVRPARALGIATAWVDRDGEGVPADLDPQLVVPDLASLARALGCTVP